MGLLKPTLRFLAREHRRKPFGGAALLLGRQCVYAGPSDVRRMLNEEGVDARTEPDPSLLTSNIPQWRGTPQAANISDVGFLSLLGLETVQAMDCSDFEDAEIVADLNQPVTDDLQNRFDLIIDGGTVEHVFDVRQSLKNIAQMLKPGGRAVHITPTNNYVNHGFIQCSPTLFIDYYVANGFTDLQVYVVEEIWRRGRLEAFDVFRFDPDWQPARLTSSRPMAVLFSAEKTPQSTSDAVPTQWYYRQLYKTASDVAIAAQSPRAARDSLLRKLCPSPLEAQARRGLEFVRRTVLRRSPQRRPWGLEFVGRWR